MSELNRAKQAEFFSTCPY